MQMPAHPFLLTPPRMWTFMGCLALCGKSNKQIFVHTVCTTHDFVLVMFEYLAYYRGLGAWPIFRQQSDNFQAGLLIHHSKQHLRTHLPYSIDTTPVVCPYSAP